MALLVAESGCNKGQLTDLTNAICRDFIQHDEAEMNKLREWAKISNSKSKSKDGPEKPSAPIFFPPANTTSAACLSLSATPVTARTFYKNELHNGTFGRMVFSASSSPTVFLWINSNCKSSATSR